MDDSYKLVVSHSSDILTQDMILQGTYEYCNLTRFGLSFKFPFIRYIQSSGDIFYPSWQVQELKKHQLSITEYKQLIEFLRSEIAEYKVYLKSFEKTKSNKQEKIREFFVHSLKMASTVTYFGCFEMGLYRLMTESGLSPDSITSKPTDTTKAFQMLDKGDLEAFCDRFGYLGMKYFKGHPWTIEEAKDMLEAIEKPKSKPTKIKSPILDIASELMYLRNTKWEQMCKGCYLFRKYILSLGLEYEQFLKLRVKDVVNGQTGVEDYAVLELRTDGVHILEDIPQDDIVIKKKVVKGIIAQQGKVSGIARIITADEFHKVKLGDILITKMTTPDFLPAMRKAAAFVTDIGGITSHASIIAREMHKPCIIATKIATKVFKDGDMIEVDAEKGIVRKI